MNDKPTVWRPMRAMLFSNFPSRFLREKVEPELKRRGVELLAMDEMKNVDKYDLATMRPDIVLHMHEMSNHSDSKALTKACQLARVPVKAFSRKKASWSFLPPPGPRGEETVVDVEDGELEMEPDSEKTDVERGVLAAGMSMEEAVEIGHLYLKERDEARQALGETRQQLAETRTKLATAEREYGKKSVAITSLESRLKEFEREKRQLVDKVNELVEQKVLLERTIEEAREDRVTLQKELDTAFERVRAREAEIKTLAEKGSPRVEKLLSALTTLVEEGLMDEAVAWRKLTRGKEG